MTSTFTTTSTSGSSSGSSGLSGSLKAKATKEEEEQLQFIAAMSSGLVVDAATQLGLKFQQNQYEQRRKALISPDDYARDRATAYNELTTSVNEVYTAAATKYTSSGLPPEMAKQFALQAARNESQIQQQLFELSFPSGANILELNAQTKKFQGLGGAPARRAPARRRRR
jgi:hypothetical protein